jgi:class 3 adenylate cyclase
MSEKPIVDHLVLRAREKRAELASLALEIEKSARDICVVFVDLAQSTEIKDKLRPDEWLVYVAGFLQLVVDIARNTSGSLVKRIGDEVMLTFSTPAAASSFFEAMTADSRLRDYRFKCAADFGKAYFFQFEPTLEPDPYGMVVDRCARIAKIALPYVVLCSSFFVTKLEKHGEYMDAGKFPLKGIADAVQIFVRPLNVAPPENYHNAILDALNSKEAQFSGFKTKSRFLSADDLRNVSQTPWAHPFLLRELLNIPRLPLSPVEVITRIKEQTHMDHAEAAHPYIGYLVEWTGVFDSYSRRKDCITVTLIMGKEPLVFSTLFVIPEMLELVQQLSKGDEVRFRGVITDISILNAYSFDYVEFCDVNINRA